MISITELEQPAFRLIYRLPHTDLTKFIRANLKLNSWITVSYLIAHISIGLAMAYFAYSQSKSGQIAFFEDAIIGFGIGFWITFFIAFFIHETIHLLAYRILGSKKTAIKFKNMMFLALSYDAVLNRNQFYFLAILPFAVLTPLIIVISFFTTGFWFYVTLGVLFLHTAGCSGDIALINYFYQNREKDIYTYDDIEGNTSLFYQKIKGNQKSDNAL